MNLAQKLQNSWELMKSSLRVIRDNPRLALFPVVSFLCTILLALFFLAPLIVLRAGHPGVVAWIENYGWESGGAKQFQQAFGWLFYTYGGVIYLVSLFVAAFFNVAFYHEILRALSGEPVSVGNGLRFAQGRLGAILMWSLLAGTVGLIIRAIEERLGWLGKIMMGLVGTVWSVAAVFAIPVIIRRPDTNPLAVLRDSAATLKKTWGESLVGFVGLQLGGAAIMFLTIIFVVVEVLAFAVLQQVWIMIAGGVLWLAAVLAISFFLGIATHVYRCALYVYASEGVVPQSYTREMMDAGWKVKKA